MNKDKQKGRPKDGLFYFWYMSKKRIAINGLGRIGRSVLKLLLQEDQLEIVAVNDLAPVETLAHLIKYDSIHGQYSGSISVENEAIKINGQSLKYFSENNPESLPWKDLEIDLVVECTGLFRTKDALELHLKAGAKKVVLSAPASGNGVKSVVLGINDHILSEDDTIVSNASCTTNCAAPMVKFIYELVGLEDAYITTINSYTSDQRLHDAPHKDLRRARAAALSIVPTTTGAAKAITKIFPHLDGKMGGCGIRVPVPNGSLTDISCIVNGETSIEEVNNAFKQAAENELKGYLQYTEDPLVSIDVVGNPHSCIYDSQLSSVLGRMVKIVGWYDNEMGYSNRLAELVIRLVA